MDKDSFISTARAISVILFLFLAISSGYVYGLKGALLIIFILWTLTSLLALVGAIPIVGQVVYWLVATKILFPTFYSWFPDIEPSWVTATIFWLGMIYNVSITISIFAFRSIASQL